MDISVQDLIVSQENQDMILKKINCEFMSGGLSVIHGPSGGGKSTLLSCVGLLLTPSSGKIHYGGNGVELSDDNASSRFRLDNIGFIYQDHRLVNGLDILENTALPLRISGEGKEDSEAKAHEYLSELGLGEKLNSKITTLSGGEKQRVSIARALINSPSIILADEPTAALDAERTEQVIDMFLKKTRDAGITVVMVTHDPYVISRADNTYLLKNGMII